MNRCRMPYLNAYVRWLLLSVLVLQLAACATGGSSGGGGSGYITVGARDAIAVHPQVKVDFEEALRLLKQEEYKKAIDLLESITLRENRITAPFVNLGIAYMKTGKMEQAEESLLKAVKLDKTHPIANNELGLLYRRTGRFAEARRVYERTLNMYPDFLPVRKNLAILCDIYMHDRKCALEHFEKLATVLPEDEKLKIWIAEIKNRKE